MMKRLTLCAGMATLSIVLLAAPQARAVGLNLGWGAFCPTNVSSLANQADPCDGTSQTGLVTYLLVGSVVPPNPAPTVCLAQDWFIDFQENAVNLSDYWKLEDENQPGQLNVAGCRGANSINSNIGSLVAQISSPSYIGPYTGCNKAFWGNTPAGGVNYAVLNPDNYPGILQPNRARLIGHWAKSPGTAMVSTSQYLAFNITLDTNHQIVDAANPPSYVCAGCADGVCIVFNQIILYQPPGTPGGDYVITDQDVRRTVTWQGGGGQDCTMVPVKRATWGQVKSLYR